MVSMGRMTISSCLWAYHSYYDQYCIDILLCDQYNRHYTLVTGITRQDLMTTGSADPRIITLSNIMRASHSHHG